MRKQQGDRKLTNCHLFFFAPYPVFFLPTDTNLSTFSVVSKEENRLSLLRLTPDDLADLFVEDDDADDSDLDGKQVPQNVMRDHHSDSTYHRSCASDIPAVSNGTTRSGSDSMYHQEVSRPGAIKSTETRAAVAKREALTTLECQGSPSSIATKEIHPDEVSSARVVQRQRSSSTKISASPSRSSNGCTSSTNSTSGSCGGNTSEISLPVFDKADMQQDASRPSRLRSRHHHKRSRFSSGTGVVRSSRPEGGNTRDANEDTVGESNAGALSAAEMSGAGMNRGLSRGVVADGDAAGLEKVGAGVDNNKHVAMVTGGGNKWDEREDAAGRGEGDAKVDVGVDEEEKGQEGEEELEDGEISQIRQRKRRSRGPGPIVMNTSNVCEQRHRGCCANNAGNILTLRWF